MDKDVVHSNAGQKKFCISAELTLKLALTLFSQGKTGSSSVVTRCYFAPVICHFQKLREFKIRWTAADVTFKLKSPFIANILEVA